MKKRGGLIRSLTALLFLFCFLPSVQGATIDVMIVYDTTAKSWVNTQGGMSAFATDAVARMNQAMTNSNVDLTFRLVHAAEVAYTYSGNLSTDLDNLQAGTGGLSVVRQLRDTYNADLVAMLVDTGSASGTVGVGYILSTYGGLPDYAFSTNAIRSVDISHTLTHEVGHNLGCGHSKYQTSSPGPNTSLNTYSAGWYFTGTNGTKYHTIMAYNSDGYGNRYAEAPLFSTPLLAYEGTTAGDAQNGDNARNIRETMDIVAAYYTPGYRFVTAWGSSGTGSGQFNSPNGIAVDASGYVYVADTSNNRIQKFTSSGAFVTAWGSSGTGNGQFSSPYGIAVESLGFVYMTDGSNNRIQKFTSGGSFVTTWGSWGTGNGQFIYPYSIAVDTSGYVFVVDKYNHRIQKFTTSGTFVTAWGSWGTGNGQFSWPEGIAVDVSGYVYVVDTNNNRIQKFTSGGTFVTTWGVWGTSNGQFGYPYGIAIDASSYIYVADKYNNRIQKFTSGGAFITKWGSSGTGNGQFNSPEGVAVDAAGNVYAVDKGNYRVQKFAPESGSCTYTVAPQETFFSPLSGTGSIAVTASASGCPWTAASGDSWITIVSGSGAGNSAVSYSIAANSGAARSGTLTVGGQTITITQAGTVITNSVGPRNSIKMTDVSGSLSANGAAITIQAWDADGNAVPESGGAYPLKLYNNETITLSGTILAARFLRTPMTYEFIVDSPKVIITNVKSSVDGTLNIPSGYTAGTTNFVANAVGRRNAIKITDMSGSLAASGAAITIKAWDAAGNALAESGTALPLTLNSHATTTINGPDLMARFTSGTPMSYEFTVDSPKLVITNVKSSADGSINIPYVYTNGTTNFVANSIGPHNMVRMTELSGSLSPSGASITIASWDTDGNPLTASASAYPLTLYNRETITLPGTTLSARFTGGTPMTYEFTVGSAKYLITNVKNSVDGTLSIPSVHTNGMTTYATNFVSSRTTIKVTDLSGALPSTGATIAVSAWDADGNPFTASGSATPLTLFNHGTTIISGTDLAARFPTGTPASYEFSPGSAKVVITNITSSTDGTINVPFVYSSGVGGGI